MQYARLSSRIPQLVSTLSALESVTNLDVTYDNKLKFGLHTDKVKANGVLFSAFVKPVLEYPASVMSH